MARNTLSFFLRLFSSKKKRILEKREKQHSISESSNEDTQEAFRNLEKIETKVRKETTSPIRKNHEEIKASFKSHVHDLQQSEEAHQAYKGEVKEKTNYGYAEYSSATAEATQYENGGHVGIAKTEHRETTSLQNTKESASKTPNETSHDDELEYDSMVLLSKLEQLMIKISDNSVQRSIPLMMESLVEMVNCLIDFSDQLSKVGQRKITLNELLDRDEQSYKILNPSYSEYNKLSVSVSAVTESANSNELFTDITNDLLRLINVYLSASVKAFKSNQVSEQWKTLYTGFFISLTKVVRSSQANQQG